MDELTAPVLDHLDRGNPGGVVGVYLYGSGASAGLRPDSDLDLLLLTRRSLTASERRGLVTALLAVSGWVGHAATFPDAAHGRPVELTSVVVDDVRPWRAWPRRDFQYGEWLRGDLVNGHVPQPEEDPDVVTLFATALPAHRVLRGPALSDLVAPVRPELLRDAVRAGVPGLLEEIDGDERNVLLTLARVLVTLETARIVTKDAAADTIALTLTGEDRRLMERARDGYLGTANDDWTGLTSRVYALARRLAGRASADDGGGDRELRR